MFVYCVGFIPVLPEARFLSYIHVASKYKAHWKFYPIDEKLWFL